MANQHKKEKAAKPPKPTKPIIKPADDGPGTGIPPPKPPHP